MEHVIAERVFEEPIDVAEVEQRVQAAQGCLRSHRVRHLRSCVSLDGRRMICEYEAPDAESVRAVALRLGIPYERVWTAKVIRSEDAG